MDMIKIKQLPEKETTKLSFDIDDNKLEYIVDKDRFLVQRR